MVRPFNPNKRRSQNLSALQTEFLRQQELNAAHTETSLNAFQKQLLDPGRLDEAVPAVNQAAEDDNDPADMDIDIGPGDDNDPEDMALDIDLENFVPDRSLEDIFAALESSRYQEGRLHHAENWMWQCAIMLPTYLRCRALTSSWGDNERWDKDFRTPCTCTQQTKRNVDLFDIICMSLQFQVPHSKSWNNIH